MCGQPSKNKNQPPTTDFNFENMWDQWKSPMMTDYKMENACAHWKSPMATIRNRDGFKIVRFPIWPVIGFLSFAVWWLPNPLLLAVGAVGIALLTGLKLDFDTDTDKAKRKPSLKNDEPYYEV